MSADVDAPVVVLHAFGDELAGAPWRTAFAEAGWTGPIVAPDLPGHGEAAAPVGGNYEQMDGFLAVLPLLAELGDATGPPVVVGCGVNGWAAHVLGLAGRASAVVVVDGLGGPWTAPRERIAAWRESLRALADDAAALGDPPPRGLDPRVRLGMVGHGSRRLAVRAAVAMPVPVLVVESPSSPLPADDVDALAAEYRSGATVERVTAATAEAVAAVVAPWMSGVLRSTPSVPSASSASTGDSIAG